MPIEVAQALHASRMAVLRPLLAGLLAGRDRITLEIGCGHGHFFTAYAEAHPEEFCIGIDIIADRLDRAERKTTRAGLANIAWVKADAAMFVEALPAHVRLGRVFILFPDPWPKRRHWKNRLIQPEFLSALAGRAGEGAEACFRTDHEHYFTHASLVFAAHPCWWIAPPADLRWPFEQETVFQQRAGGAYHSLVASRTAHPVPPPEALVHPEPPSMPEETGRNPHGGG